MTVDDINRKVSKLSLGKIDDSIIKQAKFI